MYEIGTALYPSIYMREKELNADKRVRMITGRVEEAKRVAAKHSQTIKILPYLAIKYQDTFKFLSKVKVFLIYLYKYLLYITIQLSSNM